MCVAEGLYIQNLGWVSIQLAEITYKWQLHISYFTLLFNSAIQQFCMNVLFNWESTAYVLI